MLPPPPMLPMLPTLLEYVEKACSFKRVLTTGLLALSIVLLPPSLSQLSAGPPPTLDRAELTACQIADALMLPLFYGRVRTACGFQKGSPRQRCRRSSCRRQRLVISRWHAHS